MKKIFSLLAICICITTKLFAQNPGDTIVVPTYSYSQTYNGGSRDTVVNFPNVAGQTYEKIIMLYNMRCKGGVVGSQVTPQGTAGCGEWDYSNNTYVIDSTRMDSVKATHADYVIGGFTGTTYKYTTNPTYTYYKYNQQQVIHTATTSETLATVGTATTNTPQPINTAFKTSKTQYLFKASELTGAGLVAGNITGLKLNITNPGSDAHYLKIRIKSTTQTVLSAASPEITGFTEVYFLNTTFTTGANQFNFYNNFPWNGIDNLLVEFSFTNKNASVYSLFSSDNTPTITGLATTGDDYNFEYNGSNKINIANNNFPLNTNQLSISFWANGNANFLPRQTSFLEATTANGTRQVNIHFPWDNSNIYWDCGNGTTGYDRINQLATAAEYASNWVHWTFTKNCTTGIMNIYKNGALWLTGSGKTIPIQIANLVLGTSANGNNTYFGKVDEFALWNTELSQATIQAWMNKNIDATHPNFANLLSYYKFNDGSGISCIDNSATPALGTVSGTPVWNLVKGIDIFKGFMETTNRPITTFVQGVYTQSTNTIVTVDSIVNSTNMVQNFTIVNNIPTVVSTNNYYQAGYTYVYNGDTGALLDSVNNANTGIININTLNYYTFSPSRLQLMSFVTPYGNSLNLGTTGKTWSFDVSDFAPVLKGTKRLQMDAGGQWQEDMDVKFLFIVGKPPRAVLEIKNIWKVEAVAYANILNDFKFEPRTLGMAANASTFKIRSTITGHGQQGEFVPQNHLININNNANPQFNWQVVKGCGDNPVYPQGGTWIYDRAGWCPGMATNLVENNITPYVSAGSNAVIDYGLIYTPQTASDDSRYWVSNQLVSYGAANYTNDASITDIKNPTNRVEYARTNAICANALITIKNTGTTPLTKAKIEYWVNNNSIHETYNWTGNLAFMESADVSLPTSSTLYNTISGATNNTFTAIIKTANNSTDQDSVNNKFTSTFDITSILPAKFIVNLVTNNMASENSYTITDANGAVVFSKPSLVNSTNYKDTITLPQGCYQFVLNDLGGDGLNFWANTAAYGGTTTTGTCSFKNGTTGANIKTINPDFGNSTIYNFTIDYPLSFDNINLLENKVTVYPNPANTQFTVEGKNIQNSIVHIYNTIGQEINLSFTKNNNAITYNSTSLSKGLYTIMVIDISGNKQSQKLVIE